MQFNLADIYEDADVLKKAAMAVDELCINDNQKAQEIYDKISNERYFDDKSHII